MQTVRTAELSNTTNANEAAVSTPREIDLADIVAQVAKRKSAIGETLVGNKGKSNLFTGVCSTVKSMSGMARIDELASTMIDKINDAIKSFWKIQFERVFEYGEIQTVTFDKPSEAIDKEGKVAIHLNSTIHSRRNPKNLAEYRLNASFRLKVAEKRLAYMEANLAKYDRVQFSEIKWRITCLEVASTLTEMPSELYK